MNVTISNASRVNNKLLYLCVKISYLGLCLETRKRRIQSSRSTEMFYSAGLVLMLSITLAAGAFGHRKSCFVCLG